MTFWSQWSVKPCVVLKFLPQLSHFTKTSSRTAEAIILSENFYSTVYYTETYLDSSHFSNTTSITSESFFFITRLFVLSFFHIKKKKSPCFFSSHLTWWLLFNRTETLKSSFVNWKVPMPTESLNRFFFFASIWQKARHFSTKAGSIFLSDKGHITKVNVRNQHFD